MQRNGAKLGRKLPPAEEMKDEVMQGKRVGVARLSKDGPASSTTALAGKRPASGQQSKTQHRAAKPASLINQDMEAVLTESDQKNCATDAKLKERADMAATEEITFDYLLRRVVENTAAMTTKTTFDGSSDEDPVYRVQID